MKESKEFKPKQLDINFQSEEDLLKEKKEVGIKYNILDFKKLVKKDEEWYLDGVNVKQLDDLYSDNDNAQQFKIVESNKKEIDEKNEEVRKFLREGKGPKGDNPTL